MRGSADEGSRNKLRFRAEETASDATSELPCLTRKIEKKKCS